MCRANKTGLDDKLCAGYLATEQSDSEESVPPMPGVPDSAEGLHHLTPAGEGRRPATRSQDKPLARWSPSGSHYQHEISE